MGKMSMCGRIPFGRKWAEVEGGASRLRKRAPPLFGSAPNRGATLLLMKVLSLLQDKDDKLASAMASSREAIWGLLSDPKKFANLEI